MMSKKSRKIGAPSPSQPPTDAPDWTVKQTGQLLLHNYWTPCHYMYMYVSNEWLPFSGTIMVGALHLSVTVQFMCEVNAPRVYPAGYTRDDWRLRTRLSIP